MKPIPMLATLIGFTAALPVFAQNRPYDTPLYSTQPPAALDKNYGLPTFGMRGAELPQQRTMAPEVQPREKPDFFKGSSELAVPRGRASGSSMETPLYTTTEGSTTDGATTGGLTTGGFSSTGLTTEGSTTGGLSTGGFTTGGFTTGDTTPPAGRAVR
jgi:hypothetical protein